MEWLIMLLLLAGTVSAYYKDYDADLQKVTIRQDLTTDPYISVRMLENTPQCFRCRTVYEVCNLHTTALGWGTWGLEFKGIQPRYEVTILEYNTERLTVDIYGTCSKETYVISNKTQELTLTSQDYRCVVGTEEKVITTTQETKHPVGTYTQLEPGECIILEVSGELSPYQSTDNVLSLFGKKLTEFAWWNNSWERRTQINITNPSNTNITDVPVFIDVEYDSDMNADFSDLRFTLLNDTPIYHDFDQLNATNALTWVKLPFLHEDGTKIYMYYKNPTASNGEDEAGTWADHKAVWHFQNNTFRDHSPLDHGTASKYGDPQDTNTDCIVGGCLDLDGTGDYYRETNTTLDGDGAWSFSVWAISDTTSNYHNTLSACWHTAAGLRLGLIHSSHVPFQTYHSQDGGADDPTDENKDTDRHYWVWSTGGGGDNGFVYVDGRLSDHRAANQQFGITDCHFGVGAHQFGNTWEWDGRIDEARAYQSNISLAWVNFTYANIIQYDDVIAFYIEEEGGGVPAANATTNVTWTPSTQIIGFDLTTTGNAIILFIMVFFYLTIMVMGLLFKNFGFTLFGFFLGVVVGIMLFSLGAFISITVMFFNISMLVATAWKQRG